MSMYMLNITNMLTFPHLFCLQFHPELNPIERCWAKAKQYARANCYYTLAGLRVTVPNALVAVNKDLIRQFFRKVRDYQSIPRRDEIWLRSRFHPFIFQISSFKVITSQITA